MFTTPETFTKAQLKKAETLLNLANRKLDTMEYGNVTIKQVKNLSHSDVEEIADSMTQLIQTGQDPYQNRLSPSQEIKQVYINAGVYSA